MRWRFKSPASRLFAQPLIYAQIKKTHQSSASLAFKRGIHRWPVNSPHKVPVTRKTFPFDDVMMCYNVCANKPFKHHWNGNVAILMKFSSLIALKFWQLSVQPVLQISTKCHSHFSSLDTNNENIITYISSCTFVFIIHIILEDTADAKNIKRNKRMGKVWVIQWGTLNWESVIRIFTTKCGISAWNWYLNDKTHFFY